MSTRFHESPGEPGIPAWLLVALVVALLTILGIGIRYHLHGDFNAIHCLLSLFFSINLPVCYLEACLFFRRDHIEARREYWRRWRQETGGTPAAAFLSTRVPLRLALSPNVWADGWAAYSMIDPSYVDRGTFGFNVDIANGFVTPVPTLILYAAYTADRLPPVLVGILGAILFWQWVYTSALYWVSFFVAHRQAHITRGELYAYLFAPSALWVLFPLLGLYVSVRLILDGNYGVLGY